MAPRRRDPRYSRQLLLVCTQRGSPRREPKQHRKLPLLLYVQPPIDNPCQHVGIRNALQSFADEDEDAEVGFHISYAEDIEEVGYKGIVKRIRDVVGDNPVYITFDIDAVDPAFAPA